MIAPRSGEEQVVCQRMSRPHVSILQDGFDCLPTIRRYVIATATENLAVASEISNGGRQRASNSSPKAKKISPPARGISLAVGWLEREGFP
jgi:hypothetical protein